MEDKPKKKSGYPAIRKMRKSPAVKRQEAEEHFSHYKEVVEKMASIGCTLDEIAMVAGLTKDIVKERFDEEFHKGLSNLKAAIRKAQVDTAIREHNPTMLIWLGKNYLGQREPKQSHEHSGNINLYKTEYGSRVEDNNDKVTGFYSA